MLVRDSKSRCTSDSPLTVTCYRGDQAIDMIYLYMLIIWEVETYPGAWASALMQPIYKGGGKDRHSPASICSTPSQNSLKVLWNHVFLNSQNSITPLPPLSRVHELPAKPTTPSTRLLPPYKSDANTGFPVTDVSLTLLLPTHLSTENAWV